MRPVEIVRGTMLPMDRADVDTDQVIPQQYLKRIERHGYGEFLFFNWAHDDSGAARPDFVIHDPARQGAKVLVTGPNFGCGSSREHATWAIQDWGIEAVIAGSIADIFKANAVNIGLLPIELDETPLRFLLDLAKDPSAEVVIDLPGQSIAAGGQVFDFEIDASVKRRLTQGLDRIGETMGHDEAISRHEASRPTWYPQASVGGAG